MSDLTRTAAKVSVLAIGDPEIYTFLLGETGAQGNPTYLNATTGKLGIADANGSGTDTFFGIILDAGGANQAVGLLKRGFVTGWDLSGLNYGAAVYVSNTVGELADAAGSTSLLVGHVVPMPDKPLTKVLYINALAW